MLISRVSPRTGETNVREIAVTEEQLQRWSTSGALIQTIMPHLSDDDREFIMTGYTPEDWDAIFGSDED
jgi:hypothetical protein